MRRLEKRFLTLFMDYHEINEMQYQRGDYDATIDLVDLARCIKEANLTDKQRDCLRLVYVDDLEQSEAGLKLGITKQTVNEHIKKAIRKIVNVYTGREEGKDDDVRHRRVSENAAR